MPVRERQQPPAGHGELLCEPPFEQWREAALGNQALVASWPGELRELREAARRESVSAAREYSEGLRVPHRQADAAPDLLVMTGHQPELYHPGVWAKAFLMQRFIDENGATGIDLVVDTDGAGRVEMRTPCLVPEVRICRIPLTEGSANAAYVQVPPPDAAARANLREVGTCSLGSLRAPALARHFTTFCDALDAAAGFTGDLASCMTAARRIYERPSATDYLELSVAAQCRTESYLRFVGRLLTDTRSFREVMNAALRDYRMRTGTRSVAQPFPDLAAGEGRVDAPFWLLAEGSRLPISVGDDGRLYAGEDVVASLGSDANRAAAAIASEGLLIAPKALTLTLFQRLFVADLFVHGTGGGRYDRVTDDVIRRYFDLTPPGFAVASMTMLLPLGAPMVRDEDVAALEQRIHRFTHNPDQVIGEVEFDTVEEVELAEQLVAEKAELVEAIGRPGADRKELGARIRDTNERFAALLQPMIVALGDRLELLRAERDASEVLTDRTYPYCLWDPREVMDKVR